MHLRLNYHGGDPIYQQIVQQLKYGIACGEVEPGDQLPSIRELAAQLKINPRTAIKAYEELEHAGLVVMRHGQGVFVSENKGGVPAAARRKALADMARKFLAEAARLGGGLDEVLEIIRREAQQVERLR